MKNSKVFTKPITFFGMVVLDPELHEIS